MLLGNQLLIRASNLRHQLDPQFRANLGEQLPHQPVRIAAAFVAYQVLVQWDELRLSRLIVL